MADSPVHIFRMEGKTPRMFEQHIASLKRTIDQYEDIASPEAVHDYFNNLMFIRGDAFLDQKGIMEMSRQLAFKDIDAAFKLIDTKTIPVYIPNEENHMLLAQLRSGNVTRSLLRNLGKSAVNVYPQHFELLRPMMECPDGNTYGILVDLQQYDSACGLALEPECSSLWFC